MKKTLFILLILISASTISAQEVRLSLEDCIVLSEANNPYIKNTSLDIQSARHQKKEVFAEYFPRVSFRSIGISSYDYFIDIVLGPELGESARESEMGGFTKSGFNATLTFMQPLYAGGKIMAGHNLAKIGVEVAAEQQRLAQMQTVADADNAYWSYIAVLKKVEMMQWH